MKISKKTWIRIAIVVFVLGAIADIIYFLGGVDLFTAGTPAGFVESSGRIEGRVIEISSKNPGRVIELLVDEGDNVQAGQVVARMEEDELLARKKNAEANLALWQNRKSQTEVDLKLTRQTVESTIRRAEAALEVAEANHESARAAADQAGKDLERNEALYAGGVIGRARLEQYQLARTTTDKQVTAALKYVSQAQEEVSIAKENRLSIRLKEQAVEEAQKMIDAAQASLEEIELNVGNATIVAPADGVILERIIMPHEVVNAGTPIFTMVNPDELYLKVYLSSVSMGKVKVGNPARIFTDAFPGEAIPATITHINDQSEFTPRNVETKEQRVNLVFEVKLGKIDNSSRRLKPGMMADAIIKFEDTLSWADAGVEE